MKRKRKERRGEERREKERKEEGGRKGEERYGLVQTAAEGERFTRH